MPMDLPIIILSVLISVVTAALAVVVYLSRREIKAYKSTLEINQKRLDLLLSRLNMLTKTLSGLQTAVFNTFPSDTWKKLALDEVRALIRANEASYWRFREREQELERDVVRSTAAGAQPDPVSIKFGDGLIGEAAKKRMSVLVPAAPSKGIPDEEAGNLVVPLVVGGELWGVFRFSGRGETQFTQRELELAEMFIKQLSLALENRDMVLNREKFYLELVQTLADLLDARDATKEGQTRRARSVARGIAKELNMPDEFIYYLEFAALMHDIGKIAIDEQLLKKPGKLTEQEFEIIKKHPEVGHNILQHVSLLAPAAPMVLYHQEWFDGTGYPEGLRGEEIPLGARIVALIDAWTAMTTDRPWRPALPHEKAIEEIKKGAGTQFDPKVVEAFLATLEKQRAQR